MGRLVGKLGIYGAYPELVLVDVISRPPHSRGILPLDSKPSKVGRKLGSLQKRITRGKAKKLGKAAASLIATLNGRDR